MPQEQTIEKAEEADEETIDSTPPQARSTKEELIEEFTSAYVARNPPCSGESRLTSS